MAADRSGRVLIQASPPSPRSTEPPATETPTHWRATATASSVREVQRSVIRVVALCLIALGASNWLWRLCTNPRSHTAAAWNVMSRR